MLVEVLPQGGVRCRFQLQGATGSSGPEPAIELDLYFDGTGASGDPLILQPEAQDEALMLVGRADAAMASHKSAFGAASNGFFLEPQSMVSRPRTADISQEFVADVCQYNRCLDHLSLLTMGPVQGIDTGWKRGLEEEHAAQLEGALAPDRFSESPAEDQQYLAEHEEAARQFHHALGQIQTVEQRAKALGQEDPMRHLAFSMQEQLLPHVGVWSAERRRMLRNQVFLSKRLMTLAEEYRPPDLTRSPAEAIAEIFGHLPWWAPVAACGGVLVYVMAMLLLVLGGGGAVGGAFMILASLLVLAGLAVALFCGARHFGPQAMDFVAASDGFNYSRIPLTKDDHPRDLMPR